MEKITQFLPRGVLGFTLTEHVTIKQSSLGIGHPPTSQHYERTKNFQLFDTLESFLSAGGLIPQGLSVSLDPYNTLDTSHYSRAQFGHGWADMDGDCQNSRHETLISQSTATVRYKEDRRCQVTDGRWISPFTGAVIYDPSKMDIDHAIPLRWAWEYGANRWPKEKRERFANAPANLLSVEASLNRKKGGGRPG